MVIQVLIKLDKLHQDIKKHTEGTTLRYIYTVVKRLSPLRILLSVAIPYQYMLSQFVKTEFLHRSLKENVYLKFPD